MPANLENIENLRNETSELPRTRGAASKLFKSKRLGNSIMSINLLSRYHPPILNANNLEINGL